MLVVLSVVVRGVILCRRLIICHIPEYIAHFASICIPIHFFIIIVDIVVVKHRHHHPLSLYSNQPTNQPTATLFQVDMNPAFHWNIKQLFVYVVATYATPTNPKNQIVLWDRIIENIDSTNADGKGDGKIINESNVFVKYGLVDQGAELRGKEVELSLMWDHMPLTGMLYMGGQKEGTASKFVLPEEYN